MKRIHTQPILLLACFLITLSACRVQLVPSYDQQIADQIVTTAKMVDQFYLYLMETPTGQRDYEDFAAEYIQIEVELNSLLRQNRVRPLNENSTRICEIALELWVQYKEEHKTDGTLSDGLITLNRTYMSDVFYAMQVAEEGSKLINESN